jgi:type III restriction enzyme
VTARRDEAAPLPTHWTPEQALAVFECLHALREQLWSMYGAAVQQAWCDQLAPQLPLPGMARDDGPLFAEASPALLLPALAIDLPADKPLPAVVADAVAQGAATLSSAGQRQRVQLRGTIGESLAQALVAAQKGKQREQVTQQIERHNALVAGAMAPSNRGEIFAGVPRLCYLAEGAQGELLPLEREAVLETVALNLLAEPMSLEGFAMAEQGTLWELYLDGQRLRVGRGDAAQLPLEAVDSTISPAALARWLAAELQHPSRNVAMDILPAHLRAFTVACVNHLMHDKHVPLEQLARHQYTLVQRLTLRIGELRDKAAKTAFTQLVLDGGWAVESSARHEFHFDPAVYPVPANKRYGGKFRFDRHFYPVVADLDDGGEEWRCALAIDEHPKVARWVRNLRSDPVAGFWLPVSTGRFYPDFVCELKDGRLFVAEYKGEHLRNVPREIEKGQVGQVWAEASSGKAVFAMLFKQERGLNVAQQIDEALK